MADSAADSTCNIGTIGAKNSLILQNKNPENIATQVTLNTYQECGNWVVGYRPTL
jgi:hypothetical protein